MHLDGDALGWLATLVDLQCIRNVECMSLEVTKASNRERRTASPASTRSPRGRVLNVQSSFLLSLVQHTILLSLTFSFLSRIQPSTSQRPNGALA